MGQDVWPEKRRQAGLEVDAADRVCGWIMAQTVVLLYLLSVRGAESIVYVRLDGVRGSCTVSRRRHLGEGSPLEFE